MGKTRSELREKCMVILYQVELMEKSNISYDIDNLIKDNIEITQHIMVLLVSVVGLIAIWVFKHFNITHN